MASVTMEDARDVELQEELEEAHQRYAHASDPEKAGARVAYLAKLAAFSARVMGRPN